MKILEISTCNECPFFKANAKCNESDRFDCECRDPNFEPDVEQWDNKIGRSVNIPGFCPLETKCEFPIN